MLPQRSCNAPATLLQHSCNAPAKLLQRYWALKLLPLAPWALLLLLVRLQEALATFNTTDPVSATLMDAHNASVTVPDAATAHRMLQRRFWTLQRLFLGPQVPSPFHCLRLRLLLPPPVASRWGEQDFAACAYYYLRPVPVALDLGRRLHALTVHLGLNRFNSIRQLLPATETSRCGSQTLLPVPITASTCYQSLRT